MSTLASPALQSVSRSCAAEQDGQIVKGRGRPSFLLMLFLVAVVASVSLTWGIGRWSWDIDEVETLRELNLFDQDDPQLTLSSSQAARLPRLVPVWYACQGFLLRQLPVTERNARLLPAVCAILAVLAVYVWAARRYGLKFAVGLALVMVSSPLFMAEAQQNRFYSMAVLFQVLATASLFTASERPKTWVMVLALLLASLAVLSHSLLVVYFVLAATAAAAARLLSGTQVPLRKFAAVALACALLYVFYMRPLTTGWNSGAAFPLLASVLPSVVSEATVPVLALALVGGIIGFQTKQDDSFRVWAILGMLTALAILALPRVIRFNAQYTLLFLLPIWVLAVRGVMEIGARLGHASLTWSWYLAVALLLLPRFASYYQDGSRKDLWAACEVIQRRPDPEQPIYCNMANVLRYYMPTATVRFWDEQENVPDDTSYIVLASNGWDAPPQINGKTVEMLARIGKRRFDEQAYVVSVYRVCSR